ncbi:restriction endonuclease [Intestinimonas butyriciproducens]|uniref:restriction endonuclease n=1 Tax=Intestinimonas butyriciproducens TaxID=1297617 RepID=UPI00242FCCA2|nr:restriction endonuclease [Intestinimonas butyriciproducens]
MREWERQQRLLEYIKTGQKIKAIQEFREQAGCSLAEAKTSVEQLEQSLKQMGTDTNTHPYNTPRVSSIDGMDGHEFEYFCADLLSKSGFTNVKVTPGSGDQGVDVLCEKDSIKYAVQCKNYASALGNTPIQEVSAGKMYYGCHVGVVMANSTFTPSAIELARVTGTLLWDRTYVEQLIQNAGIILDDIDDFDDEDDLEDEGDEKTYSPSFSVKSPIARKKLRWQYVLLAVLAAIPGAFCLLGAPIILLTGAMPFITIASMLAFFVTPYVLFTILAETPKESTYIKGKTSGITKKMFVTICVAIMVISFILIGTTFPEI